MNRTSSRRTFLAGSLAVPAVASAATSKPGSLAGDLRLAADGPQLRYRQLGKTGLKVTEVGFGCMITSDPTVVEAAADIGINFFDTARGYQNGNNERMVGAALGAKRKDIVLSTKTHAGGKAEALADLETSLRELGTDWVDIWHLHGRSATTDLNDDLLEALETAKQQGKARFAGFSTHSNQPALLRHAVTLPQIDVVLAAYNFSMDADLTDAIATAQEAGKGIIAMKVMAGGFRRAQPGTPLHERLQRGGAMLAALKWVLNNKNVNTTVPSITDMEQLDDNLKAMSSDYTDEDRRTLARQLDHIRPLYCRTCGSCDGLCPQGLPVAEMLRHLSYADGYGQFQLARESFQGLPATAPGGALLGVRRVRHPVPQRRPCRRAADPRPGAVLMRWIALLLATAVVAAAADAPVPNCGAVDGWSQKGDVRTYVPNNLFDYMDGNAEGYIVYGFRQMTGVTCVSGDRTIDIDYFEMASPEMAWGIFASNRHPRFDVQPIGTIAQIMPRRATFAKGSYFVELAAHEDQLEALEAFVKALEPGVPGPTDPPAMVGYFPAEGLDAASLRLVPQSVLGLRMLARGYVASYSDGRAFLVEEASADAAAGVMKQLEERLTENSTAGIGDGAITGKDRYLGRMCVARKGSYLAGFVTRDAGADIEAHVTALVAKLP